MAYDIGQTCMLVNMGLTRGECASWVQAWGSLLAVAGAAIGIWWQLKHQAEQRIQELRRIEAEHEKARIAEEVRRLSAIAGALFQCIVTLKRVEQASRNRLVAELDLELDSLQRLVTMLAGIPALDVPDLYAAYAIAEAQSVVNTLRSGLRKADQDHRTLISVPAEDLRHYRRTPYLNAALDNLVYLEQTLKVCLEQRGSDLPAQTARLNDEILHTTEQGG